MKLLTGNDRIMARPLYKEAFYFKPQFKMVLACNKLPYVHSTDGGTWRRIRVTPWECRFIDLDEKIEDPVHQFYKDMDIDDKMDKWKQAFMWLMLKEYYPVYRKNGGVPEPAKVKKFSDEYRKTSDVYFEFLNDQMEITELKTDWERCSDVYDAFKAWHRQTYSSLPIPSKRELEDYIEKSKYKVEIKRTKMIGIKFFTEGADDLEASMDDLDA